MFRPADPQTADALDLIRQYAGAPPRLRVTLLAAECARLAALVDALAEPDAHFTDRLGIPAEGTQHTPIRDEIERRKELNKRYIISGGARL